MKLFVSGLVLLAASSSYAACPNLAGSYQCASENGALVTTTLTQSEVNGVTTYQLSDDTGTSEFIADGLTRTAAGKVQSGNDAVINVTNSCSADSTTLVMDATYVEKDATGATVVDAVIQQNVALDAAGNLTVAGSYTEAGAAPQTFQSACQKSAN